MKLLSSLLLHFLIILAIFTAGCTDIINGNESSQNIGVGPELNLTVVPEKTEFIKGEPCTIYLTLTNVGNNTLNVWKMEEQISYDVSFVSLADNSSAEYSCGVLERVYLTNEALVELKPGESINSIVHSDCWILNPGEYILSAVYHTNKGEKISKRYWLGEIKSNEVVIKVRDAQNNLTAPTL